MDAATRLLVWRTGVLLRRAARTRRRRLAQEVATYRTPAELADLRAAVERCPHPGREEVRRLVERAAVRAEADPRSYHLGR